MSTLLQAQAALQERRMVYEFDAKALEILILKDLGLSPAEARIEFLISNTWVGYGHGEHQVANFTGARVTSTRAAYSTAIENGAR